MPRPKVRCEAKEWPLIAKAMLDRGLVKPVTKIPIAEGHAVVNGAFGVTKQGKQIDSGEDVLRLIMDLRASNWLLDQIFGEYGSVDRCPYVPEDSD